MIIAWVFSYYQGKSSRYLEAGLREESIFGVLSLPFPSQGKKRKKVGNWEKSGKVGKVCHISKISKHHFKQKQCEHTMYFFEHLSNEDDQIDKI